ncbi:MAG: aminotransferase class I/II-fold pyridoxal phosphate-dependent enzyme [Bacteroidetes bacterium]|nr:aminotransferase class I/II-fold pyridoxal phosphate-dependent enzyme [Bacteroidota bacterium]
MEKNKINSNLIPIFDDAGFYFEQVEDLKNAFKSELEHPHEPEFYIYSRYRNPVVVAAEKELMKLEGSKWALLTQSGMSAIDLALSVFHKGEKTRPWLFFSEIYGGTNSYIDLILKEKRGIDVHTFYSENGSYDMEKLEKILDGIKPELVYFEAVSNPMLIVADAQQIIALAKKKGAKVIVDNTFLTPVLWKPLADDADLVIHSVTKYLAGHGNLTAGVVMGNNTDFLSQMIEYRKWIGHMLSPSDASRLISFLKTFEIRFAKHCDNALELALLLEKNPRIEKVHYPGLSSHSTYNNAIKLTKGKGFGGIITFDLAGKTNEKKGNCSHFIEHIKEHIPIVPTLGDVDSILLPVEAVWGEKYPYPGMIRLSVGAEPIEELKEYVLKALDQIQK